MKKPTKIPKMKILIDTCVIISWEECDLKGPKRLSNIAKLFKIIEDKNNTIECYIHLTSIQEIQKLILSKTRGYPRLDTPDPYKEQSQESKDYLDRIDPERKAIGPGRKASHDKNDNILYYPAYRGYVSFFITQDQKLLNKARRLGGQNALSVENALEYFKKLFYDHFSACPSGTIVAPGGTLHIRGTAAGNPGTLKMYLFGSNYFTAEDIFVEEDDGSYDKKFDVPADLSPNQYFAVIQHPMYNDEFDVKLNSDGTYFCASTSQDTLVVKGNNKLQGVQAAIALTKMIDENNDDIYTEFTFTV